MDRKRIKAYFYLIIVAVIWGAAGPVIKFTLSGIDPLPFLAYRFTISAIISLIFFRYKGFRLPNNNFHKLNIVIYGLLSTTFGLGFLFLGLDKTSVLDSVVISIISPLIVAVGGAVLFHDKITHREKIGIFIVLLGVIISSFMPIFGDLSTLKFEGNVLLLGFLFFDASSILYAKKVVKEHVQSSTLTNFAFLVGAATIIPLAIYQYGLFNIIEVITKLPLIYHIGVWYMALLSGTLAYALCVEGFKSIEVSEATLFTYLQPLFQIPLAVIWLNEKFTYHFIYGGALIAVGLIYAEYKKTRFASKNNH